MPTDFFVTYPQLKERGVPYTRVHLNRLIDAGKFPAAVRLGENRIAWRARDIEAWAESRPVARPVREAPDAGAAA